VEFETAEAVYKLLFLFSYTMMNHGVYSNYIVEQTPQFIVVQGRSIYRDEPHQRFFYP